MTVLQLPSFPRRSFSFSFTLQVTRHSSRQPFHTVASRRRPDVLVRADLTVVPLKSSHPDIMSGRTIEAVFSLDSTISMEPCTAEVKQHLQDMVTKLRADIPGIRVAIIAHGDFPGSVQSSSYKFTLKKEDFTTDAGKLRNFIAGLENTDGDDGPEAYELALKEMSELSWTSGSQRVAVVIGDQVPHEPGSARDLKKIDWRAEVEKLVSMRVKIHGVQCLNTYNAEKFYRHLAEKSGGKYLRLREFGNIRDLLMAVCYRESSVCALEDYEQEVVQRSGPLNANMEEIFAVLRQ